MGASVNDSDITADTVAVAFTFAEMLLASMKYRQLSWIFVGLVSVACANWAIVHTFFPDSWAESQNAFDEFIERDKQGFVQRRYIDRTGHEYKYVVFVPYHLETQDRPPLLVFLHGVSLNGSDGIQQLRECLGPAIWEMRAAFPFIVLFPQCPAGSSWNAKNRAGKLTMALLRKTEREYNTDRDRVYLTGVSSGGSGVWSLASEYPTAFAAAVPVSGIPGGHSMARRIAEAQLPIWSFYVRGDGDQYVLANQQMHQALLGRGASPLFTELDGRLSDTWWTHNAWSFAYHNAATYSWMLRHSRSENARQVGASFHSLGSDGAPPASIRGSNNSLAGIVTLNGIKHGAPDQISLTNKHSNYDLHFDVRFVTGVHFDLLFSTRDEVSRRHKFVLEISSAEHGSGGVYDSEPASCLQVADPRAQRGLFRHIWNDVRVRINSNRLLVYVNGWPLHDLQDGRLLDHTEAVSLNVPANVGAIEFRHFRIREAK